VKELETGFYKPAGGMPQGGGDDDENLNSPVPPILGKWVATLSSTPDFNTSLPLLFKSQQTF
jgi:hypothetical protein